MSDSAATTDDREYVCSDCGATVFSLPPPGGVSAETIDAIRDASLSHSCSEARR